MTTVSNETDVKAGRRARVVAIPARARRRRRVSRPTSSLRSTLAVDMDLELEGERITVTAEVAPADRRRPGPLHLLQSQPDGLPRGRDRAQTRAAASPSPSGTPLLGHVFNVRRRAPSTTDSIGTPRGPLGHPTANPPQFEDLEPPGPDVREPASRSSDLLEPYVQGGKIGLFGGGRRGQGPVLIQEMIHRVAQQHGRGCRSSPGWEAI